MAQSVSALDFDLYGAGSSPTPGKVVSENLNVTTRTINLVSVTDWGDTNSRLLGLVSVGAARSLYQTALRPYVIKIIRKTTLNT